MAIPTEGLKTDARLSFLRVDAAGRERSREAWRMLESELPAVLDAFYAHLARTPALTPLFAGHDMTRLKRAQAAHWKALFTGGIDAEFLERVRRIGEAHHRIGLDPRWYFGAYNFVLTEIGRILAAKIPRDARRVETLMASVRACVFLDMDLSFEVYGAVAREHAHALVQSVAQTFEATVRGAISSFDDVASRVGVTTENAERGIAQAGQDSRSAADAAVVTASRVQAVASASEELTASIASVAAQVTQVADAAGTARGASDLSRGTVAGLSATIDRIGGALKLIGTIASQTNLLALNATIEAARAGEAGKGFAVVAGEVKTLAGQTARATQEIADLLTEIRSGAERMSDGIGQTDRAVSVLETCTGAALGAIREQQVATTEIASNILAGADAVGGISHRITAVSGELGALHGTVSAASEAGRELSAGAAALHAALETFLTGLNDLRRAV